MAMIRQADTKYQAQPALVLNMASIQAQADAIIGTTRAAAAAIIADARAERARILEGAHEQGRAAGHAEGLAKGIEQGRELGRREASAERRERLDAIERSWNEALAEFILDREAILRECEVRGLELAVRFGEKVARRAVALDPDAGVAAVRAVLELATRGTRLTIGVNPEDEALVRESLPGLLAADGAARHAEIAVDPSIPRGSCTARSTAGGTIDATLDARIAAVVDELMPARSAPTGPQPMPSEATGT
ncbi:MAG: FliH/SctL family protein [Phycisphaerales bacterium]